MLRLETVQAVAALRLLIDGWCEPPTPLALHLSTLAHQVLAVIAQHGGIKAAHAFATLCQAGPFRKVDKSLFADLLRSLGKPEHGLIEQSPDGLLMLGEAGERLVEHYSFYSVFETPEEFRVMSGGRQLGVLPVDSPLSAEMMIVFAGRRGVVLAVHAADKILEVAPAPGGVPPRFAGGEAGPLHDRMVAEIFQVYAGSDVPPFLDANGRALLAEGREAWRRMDLDHERMVSHGNSTLLFPWVGTIKRDSLVLALRARGFKAAAWDVVIEVTASPESIRDALQDLARMPPPNPIALARAVETKQVEKYDCYLDEPLLCMAWAANRIDADAVPRIAARIIAT